MKPTSVLSIVAVAIGLTSLCLAGAPQQSDPVNSLALPGTTTGTKPEGTPNESKTDESDDTLYRGKTTESENPMLRDEGALHFKTRPKEKVQEVDSLKNLHSSGSDPKFQRSLLNSDVSAIENIKEKANETLDA